MRKKSKTINPVLVASALSVLTFLSPNTFSNTTQKTERSTKVHTALTHPNSKLTADDQIKGSKSDQETTRLIRKSIVSDSNISTKGQNITIITLNQVVTLKGTVPNLTEKDRILNIAKNVGNKTQVVKDQIEVEKI